MTVEGPAGPEWALSSRAMRRLGAVLGLVALVALASNGGSVWAAPRAGPADRARAMAVVAVLFAFGVAVTVGVVVVLRRGSDGADPEPLLVALVRAAPAATLALAVVSLLVLSRTGPVGEISGADRPARAVDLPGQRLDPWAMSEWFSGAAVAGEGQTDSVAVAAGSSDGLVEPLLLALLLAGGMLAVVAGAWWYLRRSRRGEEGDGGADRPDHREAYDAVLATIDAMLEDPEPRVAIIGAYARLLQGLASSGAGRRAHEAPLEHVRRVLAFLEVRPGPVRELTELFEVARFSSHPLKPAHRERALTALRAVAGDLAAGAGAGGGR